MGTVVILGWEPPREHRLTASLIKIPDAYSFPSNSPEIGVEEERVCKVIQATDTHKIVVLKPVIDKLRLTFSGLGVIQHVKGLDAHSYWKKVQSLAIDVAKDDDNPEITECRVDGYWVGLRIELGGEAVATLGLDPKNKKLAAARLEFNPAKFTPASVPRLLDAWKLIQGYGISLATHLITARVTRCDVAIDVLNLRLPDIFVYCPEVWKVWICTSLIGGAQSMNFYRATKNQSPFLSPKKRSNVLVYDKRAEMEDAGKVPEYGKIAHTRIEILIDKNARFKNLLKTPFPAEGWKFVRLPTANPPLPNSRWMQFLDSARYRGYTAAEELLDASEIDAMKAVKPGSVFKNLVDASIWKHWPEAVISGHLADLIAYAANDPKKLLKNTIMEL